jgi:thiol-disulfide isomerase/thioredoxin
MAAASPIKTIITELDVQQLQQLQADMTNQVLVVKFGAEWCGPCKKIAPNFHDYIAKAPENVIFADIDVDENMDLYMALKKQKMVNGIPVFLAYYGDNKKRDKWFIPDDSVVGADLKTVAEFFGRCSKKAFEMKSSHEGYSYYS